MLRPLLRSSLFGAAAAAAFALPSTASAQAYNFSSCATAGVCGYVEAFFTGSILTVRLANTDNGFGSALFMAQIMFASALNPGAPGSPFTAAATATPGGGSVTSIGATPSNAWSASGVGGSSELDLASFLNVYLEGNAASSFRAQPGDVDNGTWVTHPGTYIEFTSDLSAVTGVNGQIVGLGFCTDQDCASGAAVLSTPEPATLTLFATGLIGIVAIRRRRKNV